VGDHVASIEVDGSSYGVSESVAWYDQAGILHDRGWPDCLGAAAPDTAPVVRFAITNIDLPDGTSQDQVVYVDCQS
jgi:hypothetical protein